MLLLMVAAVYAASSPDDPASLPPALMGLIGSSPFAAGAVWVIRRLWKERDEERAAWAKERDAERAEWAKERERELQMQERLVTMVLEGTKAIGESTDVLTQSTEVMRQVVKVLG